MPVLLKEITASTILCFIVMVDGAAPVISQSTVKTATYAVMPSHCLLLGGMWMRELRKCSFCKKFRRDYFTAYYHNLRKRITICVICLKKYTPVNWNGLKDEIEKLFLEMVKNERTR